MRRGRAHSAGRRRRRPGSSGGGGSPAARGRDSPSAPSTYTHHTAIAAVLRRREDSMRFGPQYVSLEPPPPGCESGALLARCVGVQQHGPQPGRAGSQPAAIEELPPMLTPPTPTPSLLPPPAADALKLYVGNIPTVATVEEVRDAFKGFGRVRPGWLRLCLGAGGGVCGRGTGLRGQAGGWRRAAVPGLCVPAFAWRAALSPPHCTAHPPGHLPPPCPHLQHPHTPPTPAPRRSCKSTCSGTRTAARPAARHTFGTRAAATPTLPVSVWQ